MSAVIREIRLEPFVDGIFCASGSDTQLDVINPSNGRLCLSIPAGGERDVERAVASARRSFEDGRWSDASSLVKKRALHRWADLIAAHSLEFDEFDATEMGKPVSEQFCNAADSAELVRFYAETVDKVTGDVFSSDKNSFVTQRRVPRGVVAAVVPWNFPTFVAVLKCAPALAAGNCVVLKPSELSSRSAIRLAQLALEAGLPPGVLNVVLGLGEVVGRALGLHQDVDMVAFTGSTAVGKLMLQYSGQSNMKVVAAECGGKSPQIVFDDAVNLDVAAERIGQFLLTNQAQICSVGSRLLVHRRIEGELVEKIAKQFRGVVMGNATDPSTTFGPIASAEQCTRIMKYIEGAPSEGAELVVGGSRALTQSGGYFVEPTVFRAVSPSARLAREEIFGPVLSVIPFDDEAEAIRIANDTIYGLMAYVWTSDLSRGMRMAKAIRSSVLINSAAQSGEGPGHAFSHEPAKQSGIGAECGVNGMETYMRRQLVWFNHA